MRGRIVLGVGAWLLGAAAATGGSLVVVSELGEGIAASPSQQPTTSAANQAEAGQAAARPSSSPRSQSRSGTSGTILTSSGGTVMARCAPAGAYLLSWSPQQGFLANSVARGPAATAQVVFTTSGSTVTMVVSCSAGVPSAATTVKNVLVDDNGGGKGKGGGDD